MLPRLLIFRYNLNFHACSFFSLFHLKPSCEMMIQLSYVTWWYYTVPLIWIIFIAHANFEIYFGKLFRADHFFPMCFSIMTLAPRAITILRNLSYGWHVSWSAIQIWSSSLCPRYCHRKSLWIRNGNSRSRRISRKLRRRHYRRTMKIFSLFNIAGGHYERKAYNECSMIVSRTRKSSIKIEDSFFKDVCTQYLVRNLSRARHSREREKTVSINLYTIYVASNCWMRYNAVRAHVCDCCMRTLEYLDFVKFLPLPRKGSWKFTRLHDLRIKCEIELRCIWGNDL